MGWGWGSTTFDFLLEELEFSVLLLQNLSVCVDGDDSYNGYCCTMYETITKDDNGDSHDDGDDLVNTYNNDDNHGKAHM